MLFVVHVPSISQTVLKRPLLRLLFLHVHVVVIARSLASVLLFPLGALIVFGEIIAALSAKQIPLELRVPIFVAYGRLY